MAIPSKLYAWSLAASLVLLASCGEKPSEPSNSGHWTAEYSEYLGKPAAAEYDAIFEVLFTETNFRKGILLEAPSLGTAIEVLKSEVERGGSQYQLDYTISEPDTPSFNKLIKLDFETTTLGNAVNEVAKKSKATWNFSSGVLTFRPKKN